jgi:branched-chain amino acid transport system substrate-binding protein
MKNFTCVRLLLLALLALAPATAWCEREIVLGHAGGYHNPAIKEIAVQLRDGGQILIDSVNAKGGVLGRKLVLEAVDDDFRPELTAKAYEAMRNRVSAWITFVGSANIAYMIKEGVLDGPALPIVGVIPANEQFRTPMHKNMFHFRAGDQQQLAKIVEQLTTVGIKNIAIIARNNASGTEATAIIVDELDKRGLKPVAQVRFDVDKAAYAKHAQLMRETKPGAIIMHGTPQGIAEITRELKKAGVTSLLYAVSYADYQQVGKLLGQEMARGFIISQVMPNMDNPTIPIVKAFREDFAKYGPRNTEPSQFHLEGYMSGRLIVEAIKRSKDSSPQGVIRGLESMREFDLGGYIVDLSQAKHTGSSWVDLSIISSNGKLMY